MGAIDAGVTTVRVWGWVLALQVMAIAAPASAAIDLDRVPAGLVVRGADAGCALTQADRGCDGANTDLDLMFVDPRNPSRKASTSALSVEVDAGSRAMMTAYDASGRLIGVADRLSDGDGERLSLAGLGDIARVHISGKGPVAMADLRIAELTTQSRLPEPATWAMVISGFLLVAAVIRRRIRLSEARFTERMRRIAAGEAA